MSSKFSVNRIVSDHISTLRINGTDNRDWSAIFTNFILPLIVAILFIYYGIIIVSREFTVILTAFSVFAALLLNLMILVFSIVNREKEKDEEKRDIMKIQLLKETYENIQFTVLTSVIIIVVILFMLFIPFNTYLALILSFVVYYLVFVFIVTLFMVLKRTHSIMSKE
jgi:amino acid transporter